MKKTIIIISIIVLALLTMTCPNKQEHQEAIKNVVSNAIDSKMSESVDENSQGWVMIGSMFASKIVEVFLDTKLDVQNYFLFSIGEIQVDGEKKTVSFGILNHVFTYDEDELKEAMRD